ncbi:glycosyltransferase family 2 protein [Photobacterium leiognathi]|uniref:glycosyltransferase family 2 protein n=1 Tax=Photobacterium leiognathi TaxID=553611 RepID=UPI00273A1663|nr:glycosyltransferase family 2 protein [Photobacterium leiognathi]
MTVCFNAEKTIEKTINSVIGQNNELFQYIIIDGGSTDSTGEIINKYASYIDIYISEKDNGIYDAMNKGLSLVDGEYVIFMNSGDVFYDSNILDNIKSICDDKYDIIYGDHRLDYGRCSKIVYSKSENEILNNKLTHMPFCHQSVFVRKDSLGDKVFHLEYKIVADFDMIYYLLSNYNIKLKKYNGTVSLVEMDGISDKYSYMQIKERERLFLHTMMRVIIGNVFL